MDFAETIQRTMRKKERRRISSFVLSAESPQTLYPLRPIVSGLRHPTVKRSQCLDDLLRPLFDRMTANKFNFTPIGVVFPFLMIWMKVIFR